MTRWLRIEKYFLELHHSAGRDLRTLDRSAQDTCHTTQLKAKPKLYRHSSNGRLVQVGNLGSTLTLDTLMRTREYVILLT